MKTILVTGGAGFIGSNFVRYILENYPTYKLVVLDILTYAGNTDNLPQDMLAQQSHPNSHLTFWYGNVLNADLVNTLMHDVDTVVHFAAESHVTRSIYDNKVFFETDVLGTQVIANAVLKNQHIERFIHISTSEVYGAALTEVMNEDHPLNPMSPYASAKCGADRLVYSYWATYGIPAVILRPFNNYGPYQHLEKAVPRFVTAALLGEPMIVHGQGDAKRDWLYVLDHCRALDNALHVDFTQLKGQVINLGSGVSTSVVEVAQRIKKLTKASSDILFVGDRPGQVVRHTSSTQKALKLLNWKAATPFSEGLQATISWYRSHPKWWEKSLWLRQVPIRTTSGKVEFH